MRQIAEHYRVGETVVWKRIKEYSITLEGVDTHGHRRRPAPFTEEHLEHMAQAIKKLARTGERSATWKGGPVELKCAECGEGFRVTQARVATAKFCSLACRSEWRKKNFLREGNPKWQGGERVKTCLYCGKEYVRGETGLEQWTHSKFCSKECADQGGLRLRGAANPRYREDARRRSRGGSHSSWAESVISRDKATCQRCGAQGVPMHAHHVKPFEKFPELRFDVSNGVTLCYACHWREHSVANGREGAAPPVGWKGDKPTRRWEGKCDWCGAFLSRPWGEAKKSDIHFCSMTCRGKHWVANRAPQSPEVIKKRIASSVAARAANRAANKKTDG